MNKLGFADAVRAHGDDWRMSLWSDYWKKDMDSHGSAVMMSNGRCTNDQRESAIMRRLREVSERKRVYP